MGSKGEKRMPDFRVTISRKDGENMDFTNYAGEEVSKKYMPMGALFPRDRGEGYTLVLDKAAAGFTLDADEYWFNAYPTDRDGGQGKRKPAKKPQTSGKKKPSSDDEDLKFE